MSSRWFTFSFDAATVPAISYAEYIQPNDDNDWRLNYYYFLVESPEDMFEKTTYTGYTRTIAAMGVEDDWRILPFKKFPPEDFESLEFTLSKDQIAAMMTDIYGPDEEDWLYDPNSREVWPIGLFTVEIGD